jgi:hypothetical protein
MSALTVAAYVIAGNSTSMSILSTMKTGENLLKYAYEYETVLPLRGQLQAILWHRWLVSGLSLWTPRFSLVPVNVGFLLDKVALEQVSFAEY